MRKLKKHFKFSEETRRKMSLNHADVRGKNNPNFGKPMSEEQKRKIGEANKISSKGKILSEYTKRKVSENSPKYWLGKKLSEAHKKKISEGAKKQDHSNWIKAGIEAALKTTSSSIEVLVCRVLDELGIEYETQKRISKWYADIFIPNRNLIIECNGTYWHGLPNRKNRDELLQNYCNENKIKLIWLWEDEIRKNVNQLVQEKLLKESA